MYRPLFVAMTGHEMLDLLWTCKEMKSMITSEICILNFILANILCKHLSIEGAGEPPSSRTPA